MSVARFLVSRNCWKRSQTLAVGRLGPASPSCAFELTLRSLYLPSPTCYALTGCLDSLVYYKRRLVGLLEPEGEPTREERESLNLEALGMLRKLEQVDPMRGARYRDLGEQGFFPLSATAEHELMLFAFAEQPFTSCRTRGRSEENAAEAVL